MGEDRRNDEYWIWRRAVVLRDNHKCQWPSCRRKTKIQVHHIVPWSSSASLRYAVSNGICLCTAHHKAIRNKEAAYADMFRLIIAQQKPKPKKRASKKP